MSNEKFIQNYAAGLYSGRASEKNNQRLMAANDNLYSYGYHYPLLVKIASLSSKKILYILNDSGYSATTGKHISLARPYADASAKFSYHPSTRDYGYSTNARQVTNAIAILEAIQAEINHHQETIQALKFNAIANRRLRPETKINNLTARIEELTATSALINS